MARAQMPAPAMLVALIAITMAAATAADAGSGSSRSSTICDTAKCGKGSCSEAPGPIPVISACYQCTWRGGGALLPSTPYIIPDCSFGSACINITATMPGIPITDPCVAANCGQGGDCEKGAGLSYQCRCQPGFKNMLNNTSMPCIGSSCTFGADYAKLGLVNIPVAPAPAPVGNNLYYIINTSRMQDYPFPWNKRLEL